MAINTVVKKKGITSMDEADMIWLMAAISRVSGVKIKLTEMGHYTLKMVGLNMRDNGAMICSTVGVHCIVKMQTGTSMKDSLKMV